MLLPPALRLERCLPPSWERAAAGAMLTSFLGACCCWSDAYLLPGSMLQLKRCWTALTWSVGRAAPAAACSQGGGKSCPALFQLQHAPREELRAVQLQHAPRECSSTGKSCPALFQPQHAPREEGRADRIAPAAPREEVRAAQQREVLDSSYLLPGSVLQLEQCWTALTCAGQLLPPPGSVLQLEQCWTALTSSLGVCCSWNNAGQLLPPPWERAAAGTMLDSSYLCWTALTSSLGACCSWNNAGQLLPVLDSSYLLPGSVLQLEQCWTALTCAGQLLPPPWERAAAGTMLDSSYLCWTALTSSLGACCS